MVVLGITQKNHFMKKKIYIYIRVLEIINFIIFFLKVNKLPEFLISDDSEFHIIVAKLTDACPRQYFLYLFNIVNAFAMFF